MFKPMLAPHECPMSYDKYFEDLKYPLLCSPKYDGVRAIVKNHVVYSRTFKPIPAKQVQEWFGNEDFEHMDGELIVGEATDFNVYNRTQSHVMALSKPNADLHFYVFDYTAPEYLLRPFTDRWCHLRNTVNHPFVHVVHQEFIQNKAQLLEYEDKILEMGFEGVMMKAQMGAYKNGRGTYKQGLIYKLKRFQDDEGVIVGFVQGKSNQNVQERDELGYAKRSTKKDGMVATETLGKFLVDFKGNEIEVAPGHFNHEERKWIWEHQFETMGKYLKFRHFTHGVKDKPRFPRAIGFRDKLDMGD
jgi:DNA ligase-1